MTTTAVNANPNSYGLVELSEEDQIKEQENLIKELDNPDTQTEFIEACKNIGRTAVAIDADFTDIKDGFADLATKYGNDFPRVKSEYIPKWDDFMARWGGETGLLRSSSYLAASTASTLTDYGVNLQLVVEIASEKDLKEAQAELNDYVDKHPVTIASTVADGFTHLKRDIEKFSKDFSQYLEDEKKRLTKEAEEYEAEIKKYQEEIDILIVKIDNAYTALCCTAILLYPAAVCYGIYIAYRHQLKNAQEKLNKAKDNLAKVKEEQNTLAVMKANFELLKPYIDDLCSKLKIFATVWSFMTEQSIEISNALNEGIHILSTKKFKVKLDLLRKQIVPLREGMRQYAIQILSSLESEESVDLN